MIAPKFTLPLQAWSPTSVNILDLLVIGLGIPESLYFVLAEYENAGIYSIPQTLNKMARYDDHIVLVRSATLLALVGRLIPDHWTHTVLQLAICNMGTVLCRLGSNT